MNAYLAIPYRLRIAALLAIACGLLAWGLL